MPPEATTPTALSGIRVLDLSRILAGPTCTQLLGDFGADIIKVERPHYGDDTRKWGPPYLKDEQGEDLPESAYYLCCNRNKRSVSIDISHPEGQALIRSLLKNTDVLIENYKVGDMEKFNLSYAQLKDEFPQLVYCSITGFGQDGPYAKRAGYDFMIQAMGGIMSVTGPETGIPYKVGVGIADIMCGMYAANAIQAALLYRHSSDRGQYIDCALFDSQLSWLANTGMNYISTGEPTERYGNGHPNIVPYDVFPCEDQHIALAIGNDTQFARFCECANMPDMATDARFVTNTDRVANREACNQRVSEATQKRPLQSWLDELAKFGVPCGPVNTIEQAFNDPQAIHREMRLTMPHPQALNKQVDLIANPVKFSETPVSYRFPPPSLGEHRDSILENELGLSEAEIKQLKARSVI
jgi:crotonobetainyl-CoA:carnitine CoA-transferase CaiB-like acyl-CoA transferase